MNIEYYIKEFGAIRKERFASFKKSPHDDFINKYARFFTDEFQKPEYLENLVFTGGEYSLEKIAEHTHSFQNSKAAKSIAINSANNNYDIGRFKRNFRNLIKPFTENKYIDLKERIKKANKELHYWGFSTLSEIVGQCYPNDFVFFNPNNREAIHFLGIKINGRGELNRYVSYQKIIEKEIKPLYEKNIWNNLNESERYSIGIEIDQFFSWIYEKYIKTKTNLYTNGNTVLDILYSELDGISIKNYFSIKSIQLDNLKKSDEIYILGENGVGKTLFLQAIILATKWHIIENSDGKTSGKLRDFYQNKENERLEIIVRGSDTNKTKDVDNEDIRTEFVLNNEKNISKKALKNIFAYGINRVRSNKEPKPEFLTLFGESQVLKNPIDWLTDLHNFEQKIELFRLKNPNTELPLELQKPHIPLETIKNFIKKILIDNVEIEVDYNKVYFTENKTKNLTIDQLADGYKSVFIWVVDLIARLSENQPNVSELKDFKGVVLIDELDLFLHVKWAQKIVSMLRDWFKGIQFIITTHSPILVLSASKDAVFYKLYKENGETKITEPIKGLSDLMLNGLVTSPLFGLNSARSKVFKNVENISNDDYITFKIHQALSKRMEEKPSATEDDFMKWIEEELEKELANQNQ